MSDEEFRDDVRSAIRRHDPDPDALRALATDLETLAAKHEQTGDTI